MSGPPEERKLELVHAVSLPTGILRDEAKVIDDNDFDAAELMAADLPPLRWIVPGILPEGFSFLAGKPKGGKSWLALSLGIAVATGEPFLGKIAIPTTAEVRYFALEDTKQRLQDRFVRMNKKAPPGLRFSLAMPRLDQGGADEIRRKLDAYPKTGLVIIDILGRVATPRRGGQSVYYSEGQSIVCLQDIAKEYHMAVKAVHHEPKIKVPDAQAVDLVGGSYAMSGSADTIMILARRGNSGTLLMTGRDIPEHKLLLNFDEGMWTLVGDAEAFKRIGERQQEIYQYLLVSGPKSWSEVGKALHLSEGNARVALHRLKQRHLVEVIREGVYAAVPPSV